jgi:hypothetical protein
MVIMSMPSRLNLLFRELDVVRQIRVHLAFGLNMECDERWAKS